MTEFTGKWKLVDTDEKFDDYMKEIGIGYAHRKMSPKITTYEELEQTEDDTWVMTFTASFMRMRSVFKLGKEFQEKTMDGREILSVFKEEGGVLVKEEKHVKEGLPNTRITRQRTDDNTMKITYEAVGRGVTAVQIYARNEEK